MYSCRGTSVSTNSWATEDIVTSNLLGCDNFVKTGDQENVQMFGKLSTFHTLSEHYTDVDTVR